MAAAHMRSEHGADSEHAKQRHDGQQAVQGGQRTPSREGRYNGEQTDRKIQRDRLLCTIAEHPCQHRQPELRPAEPDQSS